MSARKRFRPKKLDPPTVVKLLAIAEEWQRQLDAGDVHHRADISHREGLSRARVTQILNLLKLHPAIKDFVGNLGPTAPERLVTERKLRKLIGLPVEEQIGAARFMWPEFRKFVTYQLGELNPVALTTMDTVTR